MQEKIDKSIKLFNLSFFGKDESSLLKELRSHLEHSRKTAYICTPNPEQVVLMQSDPYFAQALAEADWLIPDGVGLVWASRWLKSRGKLAASLTNRLPGVEVIEHLLEMADEMQLKVLVVGGQDYQAAVDRWNDSHRSQMLWTAGYENARKPTSLEEEKIKNLILKHQPTLLFIALGAPAQEIWLSQHRELCQQAGVKVAMVAGGSFDFIFGKIPRAPQWLRQLGGEWLFRLVIQPWRWQRQLRLIQFIRLTLSQ